MGGSDCHAVSSCECYRSTRFLDRLYYSLQCRSSNNLGSLCGKGISNGLVTYTPYHRTGAETEFRSCVLTRHDIILLTSRLVPELIVSFVFFVHKSQDSFPSTLCIPICLYVQQPSPTAFLLVRPDSPPRHKRHRPLVASHVLVHGHLFGSIRDELLHVVAESIGLRHRQEDPR